MTTAAHATATATGTTASVTREREPYHHFRNNTTLAARFAAHLAAAGITLTEPAPGLFLGSSDIGNVSTVTPAIHPLVAIVAADRTDHTPEFAAAAVTERARAVTLATATALAGTALDVLSDPHLRGTAWAEFRAAAEVSR